MRKYEVGDNVILKCSKRMKEESESNCIIDSYCGMKVIIKEIQSDGRYLCDCSMNTFMVDENMILGKSGCITLQPGLAVACRGKVVIERISKILQPLCNNKDFFRSMSKLENVRIFYTYQKKFMYSDDIEYMYYSFNDQIYNYIEFSDLAFKNENEIRKMNQCKILYNDLAHCCCSEECVRCAIEI